MNIAATQYNLNQKALEVYVSGCSGTCANCHNQELWDFDFGKDWNEFKNKIYKKLKSGLVDNVWILGGEPLEQDHDQLLQLIQYIKSVRKSVKVWLWTRFDLDFVPKDILELLAYVKTGYYNENSKSYIDPLTGIKLASENQRIHYVQSD